MHAKKVGVLTVKLAFFNVREKPVLTYRDQAERASGGTSRHGKISFHIMV